MTKTIQVDNGYGQICDAQRLDDGQEYHVINDFVWAKWGEDCPDDDFDTHHAGCVVLYRDDYDAGKSSYQVVDAEGHGDGSGEWTPVEDCPY